MLNNSGIPLLLLLHSVVCDSMDHWFAPVKRRSELGFSGLLHCSTSHAIISAHQSLTMLTVYLWSGLALTKHGVVADVVCRFQPTAASNLMSWFDKLYYQVFWMLSHAVALSGHWWSWVDMPSLTWWMSKMRLRQLWFPRLVWTRDLKSSSK